MKKAHRRLRCQAKLANEKLALAHAVMSLVSGRFLDPRGLACDVKSCDGKSKHSWDSNTSNKRKSHDSSNC